MNPHSPGSALRILQVVLSLDPGGTEGLVIEMSKRLRHEAAMLICCLDGPGAWAGQLTEVGIPVVALERSPGFRPSLARRIRDLIRSHHATVVHCHHYTSFVYGALAIGLRRTPRLVYTEHGRLSDASPTVKRKAANLLLGRVPGALFAVSGDLREYVVSEGFPAHRVEVIHNGIEPGIPPSTEERSQARKTLGLPAEGVVLGTVARLDPVKDLGTMIHAFANLPADVAQAQLMIIGDGPERQALAGLARELGVDDRVRFAGAIDGARRLLPALDVYVNSSITEGISVTILEAMAAALPVLATRVGGTPEVIEDARVGMLVPPRDAGAMTSAMTELIRDREKREVMGRAGRRRVESHFTLDRMLALYREAYRARRD